MTIDKVHIIIMIHTVLIRKKYEKKLINKLINYIII